MPTNTFNQGATTNSPQFSCYMFRPLSAIFKSCQSITRISCKVQCCFYYKTNSALKNVRSVFKYLQSNIYFCFRSALSFICLTFQIGESMISSMIYGTLYLRKGKGKVRPRTGHEVLEGEQIYSCTLSLTSTLDGVGDQRHALAALPLGKTRYPLYRMLGEPQGGLDGCAKSRPHRDSILGMSSPQPVATPTALSRPSNRHEYQEYFVGCKGGRCTGLTNLPLSCADCFGIWQPQLLGTLRVCPGLQRDCFTFVYPPTLHYNAWPILFRLDDQYFA